jgi:hypothetical protein
VPSQVTMSISSLPRYQREREARYPYPAHRARSERLAVTTDWPRHGCAIHQPQQLRAARRLLRQPPQRRLHQRCRVLAPLVALRLAGQPGEQMPGLLARGPQPVHLTVIAQHYLRHGQADQLSVRDYRPLARTGPGEPG